MSYVRPCPRCGEARPAEEIVCQGRFHEQACHWSLIDILPIPELATDAEPSILAVEPPTQVSTSTVTGHCRNGHPLEAGEFMCMVCGEPAAEHTGSIPDECA